MRLKQSWNEFCKDPFDFVDNLKLIRWKGHYFNPFAKYVLNRRLAFVFAIFLGFVPWVLFGFDSCVAQVMMFIYKLPNVLMGKMSFDVFIQKYWVAYYGKEFHYNAVVTYGLMYWGLSRHYDKKFGITKSKNMAYSCAITWLSIGVFEFFWMGSFAFFQAQPWVLTFKMPQFNIIRQNIGFFVAGVVCIIYMYVDSHIFNSEGDAVGRSYTFRVDKKALFLIGLTVASCFFWWYYPFPTEQIIVETAVGPWISSKLFPQTLYTISLDPTDNINAGTWFYVENNAVHAVNIGVKALMSLTIFYIFMFKPITKRETKEKKLRK